MRLSTRSLLLLLNAGASIQIERPAARGSGSSLSFHQSYERKIVTRQDCDGQVCADVCIPADAMCCDVIVGIYCEAGETCTTSNTCISDNSGSGTGSSTPECSDDEKICGGGCISKTNNCCSDVTGDYCLNGMECLSASSCDDTTGNGAKGDDSSDDSSDNSSSGDDDSSDDSYSYDNNNSTSDKNSSSSSGGASGNGASSGSSMLVVTMGNALVMSLAMAIVHIN